MGKINQSCHGNQNETLQNEMLQNTGNLSWNKCVCKIWSLKHECFRVIDINVIKKRTKMAVRWRIFRILSIFWSAYA